MKATEFKIDFIGVGVEKAGTSWLAACLAEHPEICFSRQKEIHFFNKNYSRGLDFYAGYFSDCPAGRLKGEFTPRYFYSSEIPGRIKKNFPEVKLIVCLRNPVDRAESHYRHLIAHGRISPKFSPGEALEQEERLIDHGFYAARLRRYFEIFPQENILIIFYDQMTSRPRETVQKVFRFLGVDEDFIPTALNRKVNRRVERYYRSFLVFRLVRRLMEWGRRLAENPVSRPLVDFLKKIKFNSLLQRIFRNNIAPRPAAAAKRPFPAEIRRELKEIYYPDLTALERMVNRDLSDWYL